LSSPQNPFEQLSSIDSGQPEVNLPIEHEKAPRIEDPPFSGWDVLVLVGLTVGAIATLGALVVVYLLAAEAMKARAMRWSGTA